VHRVDGAEERVKRGRLARPGGAGYKENAVRLDDNLANRLLFQG
jgi:hypothetical protein